MFDLEKLNKVQSPRSSVHYCPSQAICLPHANATAVINILIYHSPATFFSDPGWIQGSVVCGVSHVHTPMPRHLWVDEDGNVPGIMLHQERGILHAFFDNVGSLTPFDNPTAFAAVLASRRADGVMLNNKFVALHQAHPFCPGALS